MRQTKVWKTWGQISSFITLYSTAIVTSDGRCYAERVPYPFRFVLNYGADAMLNFITTTCISQSGALRPGLEAYKNERDRKKLVAALHKDGVYIRYCDTYRYATELRDPKWVEYTDTWRYVLWFSKEDVVLLVTDGGYHTFSNKQINLLHSGLSARCMSAIQLLVNYRMALLTIYNKEDADYYKPFSNDISNAVRDAFLSCLTNAATGSLYTKLIGALL